MRGFCGPFGVFVRSYAFIRAYGPGLKEMSEVAVLNANYLLARLKDAYELPFDRLCMHEFVLSARALKRKHGITALDVAKRLMDYDFHPPTIYFPLIVPEALMIEPTETEPKETLDEFVDAMLEIVRDAAERPEIIKEAPHGRPVGRVDEVKAAKRAVVRYLFEDHPDLSAEPSRSPRAGSPEGRLGTADREPRREAAGAGLRPAGGSHREGTSNGGTLRRLLKREHTASARKEGAHEEPGVPALAQAQPLKIDVDFAFLKPAAALSLPAEPPERDSDHHHPDQQDADVGPGDCEPQDCGGRVAGPADESVFLDEAPQIDGNVHAPSRIGFENTIGRSTAAVDPSRGVPR